jgi:UDP-N-acetylglucosamine acyltransferase
MTRIHKTAIISPRAEIHSTVEIGPNVYIDDNVSIGAGTRILANAYITGYTKIGKDNEIHIGAIIGHDPQDYAFDKTIKSYVEIGDKNIIREYCTIHRGTKPESSTIIGNNCFIMGGAHIAHNCKVGNNVIIANYAFFGGYVTIGDNAFISGGVGVHQFITIGRLAMISGNGSFSENVPPFVIGLERNSIGSINIVGLRRAGIPENTIREIKDLYKIFYLSGLAKKNAIEKMENSGFVSPEASEFVAFVKNTKGRIAKHRNKKRIEGEE